MGTFTPSAQKIARQWHVIDASDVVLGRLAATALLGAMIAVYFIVLGLIFGAEIHEGVLAVIWIIVLTSAAALAFGSIVAALALRTNSASVVQGIFPLVFVILFLSSAFFPANLILEPAKAVATVNPVSLIVEGVRDPVISSLTVSALAQALAALAGVAAFSMWLSSRALRYRLRTGG